MIRSYFRLPQNRYLNSVLYSECRGSDRYQKILLKIPVKHTDTIPKIWNKCSQKRYCAASAQFPLPGTILWLWVINDYLFPRWVCLFCCRKICGPMLGIAHRPMNVEIETGAAQFLFLDYINVIFVAVQPMTFSARMNELFKKKLAVDFP